MRSESNTMPPKKVRWKFPFTRAATTSSTSSSSSIEYSSNIPASFICPISSTLMSDPVILPSGLTFDRPCIEACSHLGFTPPSLSSSPLPPPSLPLIPNSALRAAILDWCDRAAIPHPPPISPDSACRLVHTLMLNSNSPPPKNSPDSSSSSLPSSSSSTSTSTSTSSSEIITSNDNHNTPKPKPTPAPTPADPLEEEILVKLKSPQFAIRESGLAALRGSTRESAERRVSLCTPRLLAAVVPMILVSASKIRINATAAVVNLSIEPANKVRIVRAGAVPPLVHVLRSSSSSSEEEEYEEARGNAAGALFSLALDDENKLAIGVLGAIPPLLNMFAGSGGDGRLVLARVEAGMALYHLSLAPNNLSKIAKAPGAIKALLHVAANLKETDDEGRRRRRRVAMMVLASLARRDEGRVALMDADAVKAMVEMIREKLVDNKEEEAEEEEYYCLGVMYEMSKGRMSTLRFRALARAVGAEEVLRLLLEKHQEGEGEGGVGKEMARKILKVIRRSVDREARKMMMMMMLRDDEEDGEEDDEDEEVASVVSDGLLSFRRRFDGLGSNSPSNSANF